MPAAQQKRKPSLSRRVGFPSKVNLKLLSFFNLRIKVFKFLFKHLIQRK